MASADRRRRPGARRPRGFTLVECLVGLAVVLGVVAAALALPAAHLPAWRRSLDGSRLDQELRSVAGLIARDLARAGLGAAAPSGRGPLAGRAAPPMAPSADPWLATASDGAGASVDYRPAGEAELQRFGYRLNRGAIEIALPNAHWQALTDPGSMRITVLQVQAEAHQRSLADFCSHACGASSPCPYQLQRSVQVRIEAQGAAEPALRRSAEAVARVHNDAVVGGCPT